MTIDEMPEAEVRQYARELTHENRRLRQILALLPAAGLGTGAVVEVIHDTHDTARVMSITVCRADRDEVALVEDLRREMETLSRAILTSRATLGESSRTGVTREDVEGWRTDDDE